MLTLLSLFLLAATTPRPEPLTPLPRIAITVDRSAPSPFIVKDTGAPFCPRGFNHVVLEHGGSGWHALFNEGTYDSDAAERTLAAMAALGANVVRVWAWGGQGTTGFTSQEPGQGLNPAYMANFIDFLRRATAHGLYVIPILDEMPRNPAYDAARDAALRKTGETPLVSYSAQYLSSGPIAAKAQCAADFVRYIAETDPRVLPVVFGWALANEVHVRFTEAPFDRSVGTVTTATGNTYDLATIADRQRCWDESILHWANELSAAIRAVDPEALVTAGLWTSDAHGRPPVHGLMPDDKDPRIPPRPSVLGGKSSMLDFIDVHIYPWDGTSSVSRIAHERDLVVRPAIVGEYGVFKNRSPGEARGIMREMLAQAHAMGYAGDVFWVWDLSMVTGQTWSAVESHFGDYVMRELAPVAAALR